MPVSIEFDPSTRDMANSGTNEAVQVGKPEPRSGIAEPIQIWPPLNSSDNSVDFQPGAQVPETQVFLTPDQIQAMRVMSLEQRLDLVVTQYPPLQNQPSVIRVNKLVLFEAENPEKKRPYSLLQSEHDFQLYFYLHPDWHGKPPAEMIKDSQSGASAFYQAFYKWARIKAEGDKAEQNRIIETIFLQHSRKWVHLDTVEKWKEEFGKHPEWQGKSAGQVLKDHETGASGFYQAFKTWAKKKTGDKRRVRELSEEIFPFKKSTWEHLASLDDWKKVYDSHPEWHGKRPSVLGRDKDSGGSSFYYGFLAWLKVAIPDERQRNSALRSVLSGNRINRSGYSIDDWKKEFEQHPEWNGKTPGDMQKETDSGARSFYSAFSKWVRSQAKGDREVDRKLREVVFSFKFIDRSNYTMEDWKRELMEHPEWQGRKTGEMKKDESSGAKSYYAAFVVWARKASEGDKKKRDGIIGELFPRIRRQGFSSNSIEGWQREFSLHPEWMGRSPADMLSDGKSGSASFYNAFYKWTRSAAQGDEAKRKELTEVLFKYDFPRNNQTLDDWIEEFNSNTSWQGRTAGEMLKDDESGASAFYRSFYRWIIKQAGGDKLKIKELKSKIFPQRSKDRDNTTTENTLTENQAEDLLWGESN